MVAKYYYPEGHGPMGRELDLLFALLGYRDVTFATGSRTRPRGASPNRTRWNSTTTYYTPRSEARRFAES
ncbi:hypothetical protein [Streptomyces sp. SID3343]|uniref:hypothetical protein n=1 Tax=Streptomyces sp. SID3343 TaxID=2690260 RepID=UPI00136E3700|nr:hypothetical protein [Streptomyces sp. SID3343]MYW06644.1 hypothetical protein [Streptomyces sp. SID3343]